MSVRMIKASLVPAKAGTQAGIPLARECAEYVGVIVEEGA
jgi:hypothetical protein